MAWIMLVVVAGAEQIIVCCGASMLATMWMQASFLANCEILEEGVCAEMYASLSAELEVCLGCGAPLING